MHPGIIPVSVILDPAVTVPTPEWLFLSTGIRAVDHAVETYLSIDANPYTDGACLHTLESDGAEGLSFCSSDFVCPRFCDTADEADQSICEDDSDCGSGITCGSASICK